MMILTVIFFIRCQTVLFSTAVDVEAIDRTKKVEESNFRVEFDKLLRDLYETLEDEDLGGLTSNTESPSCEFIIVPFFWYTEISSLFRKRCMSCERYNFSFFFLGELMNYTCRIKDIIILCKNIKVNRHT